MPLHAALRGQARWQVLDERGVPEIPRNPSGFAIAPVEGVVQPNLITNLGMDGIGSSYDPFLVSISQPSRLFDFRRRLAAGTGSTTPAVTDTTLDNEVQRLDTSTAGFPSGTLVWELDTDENVYRCESTCTRAVQMSADRNLTEFGFAQDTVDDILIRELLRDGGGTPITISLIAGKWLKVDHTMFGEIAAPAAGTQTSIDIEEYDAANNLVDTLTYDVTHGPNGVDAQRVFTTWMPWDNSRICGSGTQSANNPERRLHALTASMPYSRTMFSNHTTNQELIGNIGSDAYVGGTYQRVKRVTASAGQANFPWYGARIMQEVALAGRTHGFAFVFDDPTTYTKANTDTLRVGFICSWARPGID